LPSGFTTIQSLRNGGGFPRYDFLTYACFLIFAGYSVNFGNSTCQDGSPKKFRKFQKLNFFNKNIQLINFQAVARVVQWSYRTHRFSGLFSSSAFAGHQQLSHFEGDFMKSKFVFAASILSMAIAGTAIAADQKGMSGMSGMSGMEGQKGMSGMSGMEGQKGMSGMSGMSGMEGKKQKGMSGMSGMEGQKGMSGMSGMEGQKGMSGMSGMSGIEGKK
jgi:hypothetical protein